MKYALTNDPLPKAAVFSGTLMVVAVPTATTALSGWAAMYGAILVYLAFLEYLAIALGLVRWGVGRLRSRPSVRSYRFPDSGIRTVRPASSDSVMPPQ